MSRSESKDKEDSTSKDKEKEDTNFHRNVIATKNKYKVLEDIHTKLDALTHKDTSQKAGIIRPYPSEYDLVPFLKSYQVPTIDKYHGKD